MSFFEGLGRLFEKARPTSSSVQDLTKKEVDDAVNDFLKDGNPNPSNQQIAEKLGRTIKDVNSVRRYVPSLLHTRYDSDGENEASQGGRKNNKTISNKNKKKHKKLSRQHRHHSKKNRKSMKRK
jgi:hypothetical protein